MLLNGFELFLQHFILSVLGSRLNLSGHVTSSVTWPLDSPWAISYWWSSELETKFLSLAVFQILGC